MTGTGRRIRWRNFKKRFQVLLCVNFKKQGPNWSDLPRDVVECIIGRLYWADRIRIRAVCKAWSVPNRHIPTIDKVPWAMEFSWRPIDNDQIYGECRLLDPLSREYVAEKSLRGKECRIFLNAVPCASVYGWVLFITPFKILTPASYFLYSPFTTEVIKLPEFGKSYLFNAAAFSLNATSPKCLIFLLGMDSHKIYAKLCSAGDHSWMNFEFNNGFVDWPGWEVDAVYANGVFYCLFARGQLGAFNVELEEWTILVDHQLPEVEYIWYNKLIVCDADILLLSYTESWKLFKFDSSEMDWVYENNLNNHVLFNGCTSFSVPAVGGTSQLANTIFFCYWLHHSFRLYGSISRSCSRSPLYRKCVEATKRGKVWIELPSGGIWRANDLINAI